MEHLVHAFNFCSYRANTIPLAPEITRLCGAKLIKNMGNFDEKVWFPSNLELSSVSVTKKRKNKAVFNISD